MSLNIETSGRKVQVRISPDALREPAAGGYTELRIYSSRNTSIPKHSDPSPRAPNAATARFGRRHRNVLYPLVDIELDDEFEGVMELSHILRGTWSINPQYYPQEKKALAERLVLPGAYLEQWENWFCYNDCNLEPAGFYLRRRLTAGSDASDDVVTGRPVTTFTLLSDAWEGRVEIWAVAADGAESFVDGADLITTAGSSRANSATTAGSEERPVLETALAGAIEHLLGTRRSKQSSPMPRSMHLFYDYDARTFRQKSWLWTMGPAVSAFLRAADHPAMAERFGADTLRGAAREMTDQALAYQVEDPEHPADGILMCRYDFDQESGELYEAKYSPADSLFFVGWALMPLYATTGDGRYLNASVRMVEATDRILNLDTVLQQDYFGVEGVWKDFTMDESGFGMEGLANVYRVTGDATHRRIAERYLRNLTEHFERSDGLWNRNYYRHSKTVQPFDGHVRGMGWAMEAVTSAWRMGLGDQYRHKSQLMADVMLANQRPDGAWPTVIPAPGSGAAAGTGAAAGSGRPESPDSQHPGSEAPVIDISEKGTALWSLLMYRSYEMSGEECYLGAARRALSWAIRHQYFGEDPDGRGGLPGITPASGVVYRPYFSMSCSYAVAFFAHALLTEMMYPAP